MKKAECEQAIRHLCHVWRKQRGFSDTPPERLIFEDFYSWLRDHYWQYTQFRSRMSARYDIELWFDQEFSQAWSR